MEGFRRYEVTSPREDSQNPGSHQVSYLNSHDYPARDEIIARLSQIREYTEKAEQALQALPSEASDVKFRQLQEMTAEMRTTERRLMDALREYDTENHGSSSRVSLEREMSRRASSVFLEEANDRRHSEFKGQPPGISVPNSEDEKNYFLRSRTQEKGDQDNLNNAPPRVSKGRDSAGRILLSEDLVQAQIREGACGAPSEKGYDIHGIIAEIALIRRAKDESARKLDELQFAIDTEVLKKAEGNNEASSKLTDVDRQKAMGTVCVTEESGTLTNSIRESEADLGFLDAYDDAISRKLTEIHVMREKLDAMQRMINLPTPRTSTALDEEVAMVSSNALAIDSSKEIIDTVPIQKPCPQLPVRQAEKTDSGARSLYAEEHSPTGFVPYNPNSSKVDVRKAISVPFSGSELGALRVSSGRSSLSPMKGSRKLDGSGFKPFVPLRDQFSSQEPNCDTSGGQRQYMPSNHRLANSFGDAVTEDWMAYERHTNHRQMTHDQMERLSLLETYVAESNILLKHICSSISTINSQLNDHKRQLHSIQDTVEKVYYGSQAQPVNETSSYRRSSSHSRLAPDRDRKDFSLNLNPPSAKNQYFPNNELRQIVRPPQDYGVSDFNRRSNSNSSKEVNPPWDALGAFGGHTFYPDQPHHSEYYARHQDVKSQPWVSPSMDNGSSMLNNQIPPGNRTNNYWDNFRSQSRQNVFSSSGKSDSYNRTSTLSPEAIQSQMYVNNMASPNQRYDRHTNARPIRGASHFVENIGSKNRNQEQQIRMAPQRSVSVGSMLSINDRMTRERSAFVLGRHQDDEQLGYLRNNSVLNTDRPHNRVPGGQRNFNEPSQGDYANYDLVDEICARLGQLRSENIRQKTLDVVRSFVDQSVLEDQRVRSQDPARRRGNTEPPEACHPGFMELASSLDHPRNTAHSEVATRLTDVQESEAAAELRSMQDFLPESVYEAPNTRGSVPAKRESTATNSNQLGGEISRQTYHGDSRDTRQFSLQQEAPTGDSGRTQEESANRSTFGERSNLGDEEDNVFEVSSTRRFENNETGGEREQRLGLRSYGSPSVSSSLFTEMEENSSRTRLDANDFEPSSMWSRDVASNSENGIDHGTNGRALLGRANLSLDSP